ncbi:phage tail tip fiber protein [Deinococcus kurensis]|uniref:phage tail tip fiber protein n=1 Tax=Deinococcus kurensis TaxID=2662757 RepID=UPI0012D2B4C1|nr:hypothetical protein [Deinococcus kurensis]
MKQRQYTRTQVRGASESRSGTALTASVRAVAGSGGTTYRYNVRVPDLGLLRGVRSDAPLGDAPTVPVTVQWQGSEWVIGQGGTSGAAAPSAEVPRVVPGPAGPPGPPPTAAVLTALLQAGVTEQMLDANLRAAIESVRLVSERQSDLDERFGLTVNVRDAARQVQDQLARSVTAEQAATEAGRVATQQAEAAQQSALSALDAGEAAAESARDAANDARHALDYRTAAQQSAQFSDERAQASSSSAELAQGAASESGAHAEVARGQREQAEAASGTSVSAAGRSEEFAAAAQTSAGHAQQFSAAAETSALNAKSERERAEQFASASATSEREALSSAGRAEQFSQASERHAVTAEQMSSAASGSAAAAGTAAGQAESSAVAARGSAEASEEARARTVNVQRGVVVLSGNPVFEYGAAGYIHGGPDGAKNPQLRYTDAEIEPHGNAEFAPSGRALSPVGHSDVLTERAFPVENGRVYRLRATTYCTTPAPGPFGDTAAGMAYYGPDLLTTSTGGWEPTADYQLVQGHTVTDGSRRADFDLHVSRMPGFDMQIPDYAFAFRFFVAVNMGQPAGRTHISRMIVEDVTESYQAGVASEASRTSALNANASASAASGAAGQAQGSAGAAATSAGQAAESAGQAARSASAAITTAEQAAGFASEAESWASTSFDYAQQAQSAGTKAGEYANASLKSAQDAQGYSGEAGQLASAARDDRMLAEAARGNAQGSAQAAEAARVSAQTTYEQGVRLGGNATFEDGLTNWSASEQGPLPDLLNSPRVQVVTGDGLAGSKVLQVTGTMWAYAQRAVPIDPARTYRVRFRVRQTRDHAGHTGVYAGVATLDGNFVRLDGGEGTHRYCAVSGTQITADQGWRVFEGTITGTGDSGTQFRPGTVYARPMFIVNYDGVDGSTGIAQVDELSFEDVTEATKAAVSASAARDSELRAATSEQNASDQASAAFTSRSNAEAARDRAGEYAGAANEQRAAAQTAAGNASASQGAAATSASQAAGYASAALTSETNAGSSAGQAATSAGQASTAAGNSAASAQQASTYAGNAAGSASAAQGSAAAADGSARSARAFMQAAVTSGGFRSLHRTDAPDLQPGWRTERTGPNSFKTLTYPDPNYDQSHVASPFIPPQDRVPMEAVSARIRVPSSVRALELTALIFTDSGYIYAAARTPDGQLVAPTLPRDTWVTVTWDFQNHGQPIGAADISQPANRYRITVAAMDTLGDQTFDVQWIAAGRLDAVPSASQADVDVLTDELHAEVTLRAQYERRAVPRSTLAHVQTFDFGAKPFQDQVRSYDLSYTVHPGWCVQFDVPEGGANDPYFTFPVPPVTIWDIGVVRVTLYWSGPTMECPVTLHWRTGSSGYRGDARMDARAGAPIRFEQGKWIEVEFHRDVHSVIPDADLQDTLRELRVDFQTGGLPPLNHFFVTRVDTFNLESAQPLATKAEFRAQADALAAEATIKVQRGNVIAGIGARADANGSAVGVVANRFFVDNGDGSSSAYPFMVQSGQVQVNGDLIASGTVKATALSVGALDLVPNPSATGSLDGWDGTLTLGEISQSGVNIKAIYQRGTNDLNAQTRTFTVTPSQAYEFDVHLYTEQGGLDASIRFFGLNVFDRYGNSSPLKVWNTSTRTFEPGHWMETNPYFWYGHTTSGTYRNMRGLLLPPGSDPAELPFTGQNVDYVFVMDQTAHTARMRLYNLYNADTPSWAVWMHPRAYLHAAASTTIDGRGLRTGTVTTDKLVVRGENRVDDPDMIRADSWLGTERLDIRTSAGAPGLYARRWAQRDATESTYWPVREGDVYHVTVSVKPRTGAGTNALPLGIGLWVQKPDGTNNWVTGQIVPEGTLSEDRWSRFVGRVKVPPGYTRARFWMNQSGYENFSDLAYTGVTVTMGDTLIDGDQITTGTIKAERLDLSSTLKVGADLNTLAGTLGSNRVAGLDQLAQDVSTFQQRVFIPGTTEIDGGNIRTGTIQVGGNMLMNTGFRVQTAPDNPFPLGWKNLSVASAWIVPSSEPWFRDPGTLGLRNLTPAGPSGARHFRSDLIPVTPGVTYEYSLLAGAHRCDAQAYFDLYNAAGTNIANGAFTGISDTEGFDGNNARAGSYKRLTARYTVPDGVAFVSLTFSVGGYKTGTDSYLFITRPQVTVAPSGPQPALWSPGTVAIDGNQIRAGSIQAGHLAAQYLTVGTTVDQLGGTVKDSQITTISGNKVTTGVISSAAKDSAGQPVSRLNLDDGSFRFGPSNGNRLEYSPAGGLSLIGQLVGTGNLTANAMTEVVSGDGDALLFSDVMMTYPNNAYFAFNITVPVACKLLVFLNFDLDRPESARIASFNNKAVSGTFVSARKSDSEQIQLGSIRKPLNRVQGGSMALIDVTTPGTYQMQAQAQNLQQDAALPAGTKIGSYNYFALVLKR